MPATNAAEASPRYRDPMVHDLHVRVSKLETKSNEDQVELAVMKTDLSYVKESVGNINKGVNRILWAIGLSVLAATTTFVLSGGLVVVQQ